MSDPVTNIEIEDVLSSIRKLVSDGDKSRTRDPAPQEGSIDDSESTAVESQAAAKPDKLVLTPAFLVPDSAPAVDQTEQEPAPEDAALREMVWEAIEDDPTSAAEEEAHFPKDPEDILPDDITSADADDHGPDESPSDRSRLEASIAELEAAVSGDEHEYEPDGSEDSAEAFYWPGSMVRPLHEIEDAETQDGDADEGGADEGDELASQDHHTHDEADGSADMGMAEDDAGAKAEVDIAEAHFSDDEDTAEEKAAEEKADVYADDDLDNLLFDGTESMDEEALRKLISEIVREELMGTLGERITRNVRKLVRREIYRILSSQEFD